MLNTGFLLIMKSVLLYRFLPLITPLATDFLFVIINTVAKLHIIFYSFTGMTY